MYFYSVAVCIKSCAICRVGLTVTDWGQLTVILQEFNDRYSSNLAENTEWFSYNLTSYSGDRKYANKVSFIATDDDNFIRVKAKVSAKSM